MIPIHRRPAQANAVAIAIVIMSGSCRLLDPATDSATGDDGDLDDSEGQLPDPTLQPPTPCMSSAECQGGYCVAPYDATSDSPVGAAVCALDCVPVDADHLVCIDDQSCCDHATCASDGRCDAPPSTGDTATANTTGE